MPPSLHHERAIGGPGARALVGLLMAGAVWAAPVLMPSAAPEAAAVAYATCPAGPASVGGVARFWTDDTSCYDSPWFAGRHRVLIPYGCTKAPYYPRVPACSNRGGIHHGIDVDMPVGTRIYSNVSGTVVKGTLGTAYGPKAFLIRTAKFDYVLGHVGKVHVADGERVVPGQLVARSEPARRS